MAASDEKAILDAFARFLVSFAGASIFQFCILIAYVNGESYATCIAKSPPP